MMKRTFFILFLFNVIPHVTFCQQLFWRVSYIRDILQECDSSGKTKGLVVCSSFEGGVETQQFFYFPQNGSTQGTETIQEEYGDGTLTVNFKNNRLEGVCTEFKDKEGGLFVEATFKNGLLDGEEKDYLGGALTEVIPYKDGKKHGIATSFYSNGQINHIHSFTNGILNGPFISYHKNGNIWIKREYVNGEVHGDDLSYFENGEAESVCHYNMGKAHGDYLSYFENGEVESVCHYNMGIPVKSCITYFADKSIRNQEFYLENPDTVFRYTPPPFSEISDGHTKGIPDGHWLGYNEDGTLSYSYTFSKGVRTGAWKSYNNDGTLEREEFYDESGTPVGVWRSFNDGDTMSTLTFGDHGISQYWEFSYENNGTETTGSYRYGQKHGTWMKTGSLFGDTLTLENFSNGKLHGKALQRENHGSYATGTYDQGFKTGEWKTYSSDHKLVHVENYMLKDTVNDWQLAEDNNRMGPSIEYYQDGKTKKTEGSYFGRQKKGVWKEYHKNGQLASVGEYAPDSTYFEPIKIGEWKEYHPNGTLASVGKYILLERPWTEKVIAVREGEWKKYHDNGQLESAILYTNGMPTAGEVKTYHPNGKLESVCTFKAFEKDSIQYCDIDGPLKQYYDNGQPLCSINYNKGMAEGEANAYYENGQVLQTVNYRIISATDSTTFDKPVTNRISVKEGEMKEYYENGKMRITGQFVNDVEEGLWVFYSPNGQKKAETNYKNGMPNGENINYSEYGKITSKVINQDGLITEVIQMEENSIIEIVSTMILIFPEWMVWPYINTIPNPIED